VSIDILQEISMRHPVLFAAVTALALALAPSAHAEIKPIKRVEPVYPPEAVRAGTSGFVEVEFTVDANGKVASVSVLNAKPARTFESAAVKAVKQWQFAPGADGRGKVRLDFSL
jgi:protein TonB